ncbi:YciI family protein [Dyella nitratireducens]|uniref:YCII-related domain-containing protein n=1 Tax=Dyella nitratireducens TaxID=1849580 RepID=A0ABQ1G665_9GAMM|nr:YciI family protein [Dyella nitratireducens]GGA37553.1 hypothetical protein GCM10010981_28380 [Dyella nitratireducens]GLQ41216.1 hypothetical protein GCM10007902_10660 [Dyella nitratireducens]
MKTYLLAMYQPGAEGDMPSREALEKVMREVRDIREDMKAAGAWIFSGGLDSPSTATVLQRHAGDVRTTDGPFAETKGYIAGLTIIQVPDLDAALEWARKLAKVIGLPMEVRPFLERSVD